MRGRGYRRIGREPWHRRRGVFVAAVAVLGLVVIALIAAPREQDGDRPSTPEAPAAEVPPGEAPPVEAPTAAEPIAEDTGAEDRTEALALIRRANAAIAADDTAGGRALLDAIDPLAMADARIERKVRQSLALAQTTDRYLRAQALAEGGAYLLAHRRMERLAPFRRAGALSERFATRAAERYVAQARGVYMSRPGRALQLLVQAEDLDPDLGEIIDVRDLATDRRDALAAPPPAPDPPAAPAPVVSDCDPAYSGACIPNVPYDLDCDDVAAVNFASVGSDPHGFDREGDGVACES